MARAKQTDRAEARRRYRQASAQDPAMDDATDDVGDAPLQQRTARPAPTKAAARQQPQANARPGITSAFRAAYHPAHFREDFAALPKLLRHYAFLAPLGMIVVGTVVASIFWNYTGGQLAWQILVSPGSGFGLPQLVTGFFAPRASYMLGFIVSVIQGVAATIFVLTLSKQLGQPFPSEQIPGLLVQAFLAGPVSGTLFAAAAAWYRRFLALSGPKRTATNTRGQSRSANRGGARR